MSDFTMLAVATVAVAVGSSEAVKVAHYDNQGHLAPQPLTMKPVIGGFVLGLFLFAAGMASEYLATLFCYLIIVSSVLINGASLFSIAY